MPEEDIVVGVVQAGSSLAVTALIESDIPIDLVAGPNTLALVSEVDILVDVSAPDHALKPRFLQIVDKPGFNGLFRPLVR